MEDLPSAGHARAQAVGDQILHEPQAFNPIRAPSTPGQRRGVTDAVGRCGPRAHVVKKHQLVCPPHTPSKSAQYGIVAAQVGQDAAVVHATQKADGSLPAAACVACGDRRGEGHNIRAQAARLEAVERGQGELPPQALLTRADRRAVADHARLEERSLHILQQVQNGTPAVSLLAGTHGSATADDVRREALRVHGAEHQHGVPPLLALLADTDSRAPTHPVQRLA
mmetsp:Transcript_12115/g.32059  ORF Transcript_12115/g.32059 Transcript_12115/m.32059 type:complete len:225 (-) Transcript_12115:305-979(-)